MHFRSHPQRREKTLNHLVPTADGAYKDLFDRSVKDIVVSIIILFSTIFKSEVPHKSNSHKSSESKLVMSNPSTSAS